MINTSIEALKFEEYKLRRKRKRDDDTVWKGSPDGENALMVNMALTLRKARTMRKKPTRRRHESSREPITQQRSF